MGDRHRKPFPSAAGQRKFLLVAVDYFTKWVEAEPLARITEGEAERCRNGAKACASSKDSPQWLIQANGQVEVTNRILVQGIKRRLERVGGNWAEELTSVLWAYRTTPRGSTGETPFSLVYGTEAIIPAELGDLVLRRADALKPIGKLDPTWEGPYKVTSVIGKGAYELEDPEDCPLPRPWNVHNLKKYFA
ncbi:UNVERIFIED_CONTAM: hypothetical protein Slati_2171600 [Sesamum latifolium]|uniref:Gag-pol polyprotein n=1 Tax=Sesamum latifolium TaxID=2727402 RepID=A0AAW2WRP0_9LAMI